MIDALPPPVFSMELQVRAPVRAQCLISHLWDDGRLEDGRHTASAFSAPHEEVVPAAWPGWASLPERVQARIGDGAPADAHRADESLTLDLPADIADGTTIAFLGAGGEAVLRCVYRAPPANRDLGLAADAKIAAIMLHVSIA